jgi:hypothetical protein
MDTSSATAPGHVRKIDGDIKVLKWVIQEMEYRRNALVPISRLPPETLVEIFSLLPFPADASECVSFLTLISVTRVCRRWREVALSFPSLWSYINFTKLTPTGFTEMLARAKMSPLHLEAKITPLRRARSHAFRRQLEAHISHTRHLTISGQFRTMLERFVTPAPALVSLSLRKPSHPYRPSQFVVSDSLFNGTAPKLTHLDLRGCSIGWKSPLLKGLQTLKIWTPSAQEMPTLEDWLASLKEMSQLKMLTVHDATPTISVDNPHNPDPRRTVTLPSLTHFNIIASARDCALALAHLLLPALISLHVDAHSQSQDGDDVQLLIPYVTRHAWPQDTAPLQTILLNEDEMSAEIVAWTVPDADLEVRDSVTLKKTAVSARLDFSVMSYHGWRDGMEAEIFDAVLSRLPLNAISTLSAQNYTRLSKEVWLSHAPRLTKLNRVLLVAFAVRAFREMLEEDVPPNGLPRLPQLTKLIISKYSLNKLNTYHLRDMLVKRKEHGVPLEALDVRTCEGSERAMQLLSETVGNVQRPAKTVKKGHPSFFDLEGRVGPFDEGEEGTNDDEDDDDNSGPWYGYGSTDEGSEEEDEDEFDDDEDEDGSDSYIDY